MESIGSQSSGDTRDSMAAAGGTETLPCGNREASTIQINDIPIHIKENEQQRHDDNKETNTSNSYHWTLSNWGAAQAARRRNNSGTVRVDLASPEDISLDTDSTRVVFSAYGTTV